ncbi:MAG: hypothetical protein SFW65_09215 [Alphaproteobacteria bacterium]|nr:hypothetical protein [Alphaproteobacteria bacterium]
MNKLLTIATLAMTVFSTAAFADTRGDYINNPDAYGVIAVNKGITNGASVSFDIPVHASLLGQRQGAMPVSSNGRIFATSIGYYTAHPVQGSSNILGLAHSPYQR